MSSKIYTDVVVNGQSIAVVAGSIKAKFDNIGEVETTTYTRGSSVGHKNGVKPDSLQGHVSFTISAGEPIPGVTLKSLLEEWAGFRNANQSVTVELICKGYPPDVIDGDLATNAEFAFDVQNQVEVTFKSTGDFRVN